MPTSYVHSRTPSGFIKYFSELCSGHDGVGYGDYVEQITYLIFLKMADEREKSGEESKIPKKYAWSQLGVIGDTTAWTQEVE